jgi:uncharacterized integral membrane protein
MKAALRTLFYLPLGAAILLFSMANRDAVKVSLDPFPNDYLTLGAYDVPLFLVVLAAMAIGVVAGGFTSWVSHFPLRRAAKEARAEAERARAEIERLRQQALASLAQQPETSASHLLRK